MTVPREWLISPTTITEIEEYLEEYLAFEWLPDIRWDQWRALVNQVGSRDELWEYSHFESGTAGELYEYRTGYALIRDGEAIDFIELPNH